MKRVCTFLLLFAATMLCAYASIPDTVNLRNAVRIPAGQVTPCGIWQFGADGAIFEIRPQHGRNGVFDLYIIQSPDLTIHSGTLFGRMESTGTGYTYDAHLHQSLGGKDRNVTHPKTHNFIFTFDPTACSLKIRPYRQGTRLSILRWIPYLFRLSVERSDSRPEGIDGARRLSPTSLSYPIVL